MAQLWSIPDSHHIYMLKNYLLVSLRAFRKASVYSLLNITGLALGIACATLTLFTVSFQAIRAALLNPVKTLRSE